MSKIYKDILVPIPENAYVNKCDARVYLVREKVYLPDMQYNSDKRKVVGKAVSEKEMYPNSAFRLLFPEIFQECSAKEQMPPAIKVIGPYAAFLAIGKNTGLYELLVNNFGTQHANAIMDYAVYSILSQSEASEDFQAAMGRYLLFSDGVYGDSWLSDFFRDKLPDSQVQGFRNDWIVRCREQGVKEAWICIDVGTEGCDGEGDIPLPCSSQRKGAEDGEAEGRFLAGEREINPQTGNGTVGYVWAVNAEDGMPVTYRACYGNQIGGAWQEAKAELEANGIAVRGMILDREFCHAESLRLLAEEGIPYVVRLKEEADVHKELVERYGKELRLSNVNYLIQRPGVYGISAKRRLFPEDAEEAYVSLYYDSRRGAECVNRLMEKVKAAMEEALAAEAVGRKAKGSAGCWKYMHVIRDEHGTKIGLNQEAVQEEIDREGFWSIASSRLMTADEKDSVYRLRQMSGEQYVIFRSQVGRDAFGVRLGERLPSEFVVGFIAGILRTEFENVCRRLGADVDGMLKELCQLHITMLPGKGYRMLHMENGRQLALLKELGVWMSDLDEIAVQENKRGNGVRHSQVRSLPSHGIRGV